METTAGNYWYRKQLNKKQGQQQQAMIWKTTYPETQNRIRFACCGNTSVATEWLLFPETADVTTGSGLLAWLCYAVVRTLRRRLAGIDDDSITSQVKEFEEKKLVSAEADASCQRLN